MSIVQDEKELEYWSDQKLLEEAQNPTGRMPLFLIHTQIEKRKNYRDSANARKETPDTTIYEEDVAEFGGGGLGSMQQQMSMPPPPTQQMPMSAPPLQAGMGVTPMARGGLIKAKKGVHLPPVTHARPAIVFFLLIFFLHLGIQYRRHVSLVFLVPVYR